jgi:integrase
MEKETVPPRPSAMVLPSMSSTTTTFCATVNAVEVGNVIEVGTPKTNKRRSVAFSAFLTEPLERMREGKSRDDLVFGDSEGNHMRRPRVSQDSRSWFETALALSGLDPMTIHDLGPTAASLAVSSGANVEAVQRMLGYPSAAMTLDVYSDLFDDDLDDVAEALDKARFDASVANPLPDALP